MVEYADWVTTPTPTTRVVALTPPYRHTIHHSPMIINCISLNAALFAKAAVGPFRRSIPFFTSTASRERERERE